MNPKQILGFIASPSCFGLLFLFAAAQQPASAQQVQGISAIFQDTGSSQIHTYSATELDYAAAYDGYEPDVNAVLEQDGTPVGTPTPPTDCLADPEGFPTYLDACLEIDVPTKEGSTTYALASYHYVIASLDVYTGCYDNPAGYGNEFLGGGTSGGTWGPGDGSLCLDQEQQEIYLGWTAIVFSSAAPSITSTDPTGGSLGTSNGTITVYGDNLIDVLTGGAPAVAITGSGISVAVASPPAPTASQVSLTYSVPSSATTGSQNLTLTTRFGTGTAPFNIGDPTPNITNVTPYPWQAGTTTPITISGSGFGTNPSITITGNGVKDYQRTGTPGDQSITATVTIDANAPNGTATVTVTSQGYGGSGGSGFIGTQPGQPSQSPSYSVPVQAAALQILWGTSCSTATQIQSPMSVVAGQQISLIACVAGQPAALPNWTLPQGVWITGGYAASTDGGGQELDDPATDQSTLTFYFVDSGSTWDVTCEDGALVFASVQFSVDGPRNPTITYPNNPIQIGNVQLYVLNGVELLGLLGVRDANSNSGITFLASDAYLPKGGQFWWVQFITTYDVQFVSVTGTQTCTAFSQPGDPNPELDNSYPYGTVGTNVWTTSYANDTASDGPAVALTSTRGEQSAVFSATMYLMWIPAPANGCSGFSCTVPIPLGYVQWNWSGDAVNTLQTGGNYLQGWGLGCNSAPNPTSFVLSTSYPTWAANEVVINGQLKPQPGKICQQ